MGSLVTAMLSLLIAVSLTEVFCQDDERLELIEKRRRESIERYEISDIQYHLENASQDLSPEFITLAQKMVTNDTPYDTESICTLEVSASTTREWSVTAGLEIHLGLMVSVTAGLPKLGEVTGEWNVGATGSFSYTHGRSDTSSVTKRNEITVNLPAYSNVMVAVIAKKARVTVPYTATVKTVYTSGKTGIKRNVQGVYNDVHHTSFESSLMTSKSAESVRISGANWAYILWAAISLRVFIS